LYKLNKYGILNILKLRGIYLTKKINKKSKKQTLIFLRAPKHFNIGKFKIFFLNNKKSFKILSNFPINIQFIESYKIFLISFLFNFYKLQSLFFTNSIKLNIKYKIK